MAAADSGNGVSAALDWPRYLFINVDLSVHLHRMPAGEWVCLDAMTLPEPTGIGLADRRCTTSAAGSAGRADAPRPPALNAAASASNDRPEPEPSGHALELGVECLGRVRRRVRLEVDGPRTQHPCGPI